MIFRNIIGKTVTIKRLCTPLLYCSFYDSHLSKLRSISLQVIAGMDQGNIMIELWGTKWV